VRRLHANLGLSDDLLAIFWAMFFVEAAYGAYMGIWPLWIAELGAPIALVGVVLGSAGILRLGALAPSASLAERYGIRRTIIVVRSVACLGMLVAAFVNQWQYLFGMVIGAAIGEAAFPLTQHYVAVRAGTNRIRAFSLIITVGPSFALILSPLVSGLLVALFGMRAAFVFAACCTIASITCFSRIQPTLPDHDQGPRGESSYRGVWGDQRVRRILVMHCSTILALALGTSLVPTFLSEVRGLTPALITGLGAGAAIGSAIFGIVVARTVRIQRAPLAGIAVAVSLVSLAMIIFMVTGNLVAIAIAFILRGGFFSAWALFIAALGDVAASQHRARAFAAAEMLGGAAFAFAPMIASLIYAIGPRGPLLVSLVLTVTMAAVLVQSQRAPSSLPSATTPMTSTMDRLS